MLRILLLLILSLAGHRNLEIFSRGRRMASLLLGLSNSTRLLVPNSHISFACPFLLIIRRLLLLLLLDVADKGDGIESGAAPRLNRK